MIVDENAKKELILIQIIVIYFQIKHDLTCILYHLTIFLFKQKPKIF